MSNLPGKVKAFPRMLAASDPSDSTIGGSYDPTKRLEASCEPAEQQDSVGADNVLCGFDLCHGALEGGLVHALGLEDVLADATIIAEAAPELEGLREGSVAWTLALRAVTEVVSLTRGEGVGAIG
jgi:hypothetical protein